MLNVRLGVPSVWKSWEPIARQLHEPLRRMSEALQGEYGGPMENLWIVVELSPGEMKRRRPWAFRLQKRVSGRWDQCKYLVAPDSYNVGHYSVCPDFELLMSMPEDRVVPYILGLLLDSLESLRGLKRLKGFDLDGFRQVFISSAETLGYEIESRRRA